MMSHEDYYVELEDLMSLLVELHKQNPTFSIVPIKHKPSIANYGGLLYTWHIHNTAYHFRVSSKGVWTVSRKTYTPTILVEFMGDASLGELHKIMIPEFRGSNEVVR